MNKKVQPTLNKKKKKYKYEVDEILELIGLINPHNNKQYNLKKKFQKQNIIPISQIKNLNIENKGDTKFSQVKYISKNFESNNNNKIRLENHIIPGKFETPFIEENLNKSLNLSQYIHKTTLNKSKYYDILNSDIIKENTQIKSKSFNKYQLKQENIKNKNVIIKKNNILEINSNSNNELYNQNTKNLCIY